MTRICWLHLSDLHLNPDRTGWESTRLLNELRQDAWAFSKQQQLAPQFLFVTGDLAYGEKQKGDLKKQLGATFSWLKEVTKLLDIPKEQVFVVPGNHDVNRTRVAEGQTMWLGGLEKSRHEEALAKINAMFQQPNIDWENFQARLKDFYDETRPRYPHLYAKQNPHGCYHAIREVGGMKVGVFGFDGVWSSGGDGEKGKLWLGSPWQLNLAEDKLADVDLRIALIHHPPSWYVEAEEQVLTQRLGRTFHLLLHGHTHDQRVHQDGADHLRIGAGAVYAPVPELGYNLGYWDADTGQGGIFFRTYTKRGGWQAMHLRDKTDVLGHMPFVLAAPAPKPAGLEPDSPPENPNKDPFADESDGIVGRAEPLAKLHGLLKAHAIVVLYGLPGIGKTSVVTKLRQAWPLYRRLDCAGQKPETFAKNLAQFLAGMKPGEASPEAPYLLHLNQAEWALEGDHGSRNAETLANAIKARPDVHVLVESRTAVSLERLKTFGAEGLRLTGVGVDAVVRFFKQPFRELRVGWSLTNDQATAIQRRLGDATKGTSGFGAHPMAMSLLAQLADARGVGPLEALQAYPNLLVETLLATMFREVFSRIPPAFADLLAWYALYRNHIPRMHAFGLEDQLQATGGLKYQLDRCLIRAGEHESHFWVHALIRELIPADEQHALNGHHAIGSLWLKDLKITQRSRMNGYVEAAEGAYHLILADARGDIARLKPILSERSGLVEHLFKQSERFNQEKRPKDVQTAMELVVAIEPNNGKAHGFLGLALEKNQGRGNADALDHFRRSYDLEARPESLARLGQGLLHAKQAAAFLELLDQPATQAHIDDHIRAIQIRCLSQLGRREEATALRRSQIEQGSSHPAFYAAEAQFLAHSGKLADALALLDRAQALGIADDVTQTIRASLLQALGDGPAASRLRQDHIQRGTRNPAFYNDEAQFLAHAGKHTDALALLDRAQALGIGNDVTQSIRASLLQACGDGTAASRLRQEHIQSGTRNRAFQAILTKLRQGFTKEDAFRSLALSLAPAHLGDQPISSKQLDKLIDHAWKAGLQDQELRIQAVLGSEEHVASSSPEPEPPTHQLCWLHLSDLHYHPNNTWDSEHVQRKLREDAASVLVEHNLRPQLLFATGDLGYGEGSSKLTLCEQIKETLKYLEDVASQFGIARENIFMVPGNHDVNRDKILKSHPSWCRDLAKDPKASRIIGEMMDQNDGDWRGLQGRLQDYLGAVAQQDFDLYSEHAHQAVYHQVRHIEGVALGIFGFNGVWSCGSGDAPRSLLLGAGWQLNLAEKNLSETQLNFGLIHHPPSWYCRHDQETLQKRLDPTFQILLHGHEHEDWVHATGQKGDCCSLLRVAAGASYTPNPQELGYNIGSLNLKTGQGQIHLRTFSDHDWIPKYIKDRAPQGAWPFKIPIKPPK